MEHYWDSSGTGRINNSNALMTYLYASQPTNFQGWMSRDRDGNPRFIVQSSSNGVTSPMVGRNVIHAHNDTTNVTSITLSTNVANALAIGSFFKVWKVQ